MNLVKAVIRHLPQNTQVEDISDGLVDLRFWVNGNRCHPLVGPLLKHM
jgi:hypothetical protein